MDGNHTPICDYCGDYVPFCTCESPNAERAELGDRALDPIVIANDCSTYEALIDTLANLRHLCQRDEIDFAEADRIAYQHYREEANR